MAEKYLAELERLWQRNRNNRNNPLPTIFNYPIMPELKRAKALRGPDLVLELRRLSVLTGDKRFIDAALALIEHRVVGRGFKFLPWDEPYIAQGKAKFEQYAYIDIQMLRVEFGNSLRRACALYAAHIGWPAATFMAARKHLELLYRQHESRDRHLQHLPRTADQATAELRTRVGKTLRQHNSNDS
jgi:hypothetical protein